MDWTTDAAKALIAQGVLGMAVLGLVVVVFFLWRALEAKDAKLIETLVLWKDDTKASTEALASVIDKTAVIAEALKDRGQRR